MWTEGIAIIRLKYEQLNCVSCTALSSVHHKYVFGGVFCQVEVNFKSHSQALYLIRFTSSRFEFIWIWITSSWYYSTWQAFNLIWFHFTSSLFDFSSHAVYLIWIWFGSGSHWLYSYSSALNLIWFGYILVRMLNLFSLIMLWNIQSSVSVIKRTSSKEVFIFN